MSKEKNTRSRKKSSSQKPRALPIHSNHGPNSQKENMSNNTNNLMKLDVTEDNSMPEEKNISKDKRQHLSKQKKSDLENILKRFFQYFN